MASIISAAIEVAKWVYRGTTTAARTLVDNRLTQLVWKNLQREQPKRIHSPIGRDYVLIDSKPSVVALGSVFTDTDRVSFFDKEGFEKALVSFQMPDGELVNVSKVFVHDLKRFREGRVLSINSEVVYSQSSDSHLQQTVEKLYFVLGKNRELLREVSEYACQNIVSYLNTRIHNQYMFGEPLSAHEFLHIQDRNCSVHIQIHVDETQVTVTCTYRGTIYSTQSFAPEAPPIVRKLTRPLKFTATATMPFIPKAMQGIQDKVILESS